MVILSGEQLDRNAAAAEAGIAPVVAAGEPQECAPLPTLPAPARSSPAPELACPIPGAVGLPNPDVSLLLFTSANSTGGRSLLPEQ